MTGSSGNAVEYFIDRHLREGRGERLAFADPWRSLTYADLAAGAARVVAALDRRAQRRAPCPFEPQGHRRHLWRAGTRHPARRSDVLRGEAVLRLWARQFDDLSDGGRRRFGTAPRPPDPGCGARG